jgi:branched-chain amino acid transport system permease protein
MLTVSLVNGIAYGSLLFLLAAGFSMIFGVLKVINLAHGSYYLFGAHVAISIFEAGGGLLTAALAGAAVGAIFGAICERAFLYRLQGDYLAQVLVTVGLLLVLGDAAQVIWGGTPRILTLPPSVTFQVPLGPFAYPGDRLVLIAIGAILAFGLWWAVERTIFGAMVRAAVDDEETAQAIGIKVPWLRLAVFAFGGLLAGLSGALGSSFVGAKPGVDLEVFLLALVIVVVGGPGSLPGAYIAALFVGITDSVGKTFWPEASLFMLFVPMAAILVFRPTGLLGKPIGVTVAPRRTPRPSSATRALAPLIALGLALPARLPRAAWPLIFLVLAVLLPVAAPQYATSIVSLALIWAIAAMGLNVLLGYAGMPSLGHAVFFGTGAYAVALAGRYLAIGGWPSLALAAGVALVMACLLGLVALRTRHVQLLLATIALSQIVWGIAFKWRSLTGGDDGMRNAQKIAIPGVEGLGRTTLLYAVVALVFLLVVLLLRAFDRSRFRLVLNGVRENEARLAALGYNVWLYRFGAFVISGTISGIGGGLYAFYAGFVSPDLLGVVTSAKVLLMVIIGGAGTFAGPIVGAFGLVILEEILSGWTERWFMLEGILYIAVALMTRGGIVGSLNLRRRAAALRGATS